MMVRHGQLKLMKRNATGTANASTYAPPMFLNWWAGNQKRRALQTASNAAHAWMPAPQRPLNTVLVKSQPLAAKRVFPEDVLQAYLQLLFQYHTLLFLVRSFLIPYPGQQMQDPDSHPLAARQNPDL